MKEPADWVILLKFLNQEKNDGKYFSSDYIAEQCKYDADNVEKQLLSMRKPMYGLVRQDPILFPDSYTITDKGKNFIKD